MPSAVVAVLPLLIALMVPSGAVAPAAGAQPTTFHLDCSSTAPGDGSAAAPWNSTSAATAHVFEPGDRLLVRRGTTCRGQLAPSGSGTSARPITIDAYGSGALPTIAGGGTTSWTGAVQLKDQEHWTIRHLHVTNTVGTVTSEDYRSGVMLLNDTGQHLHGITIEQLSVDSVVSNMNNINAGPRSFGGISAITMGGVVGGFTDLTIRGNTVSHVGRTGIVVSNNSYPAAADSRVRVTGNGVSWIRGDGIILLGSRNGRIDHNVSAHAAQEWPCPDCGPITRFTANAAIWTGASDGIRIDHNEAYGTKALGGDGEGFDVDSSSTNVVVEDNYAHDNEGGGILFCGSRNAVARFNVLQNNGKSAIAFIGSAPARNTSIYNNTIYASKRADAVNVRTFNGHIGTGVRFFNNIVYNYGRPTWAFPTNVWARSNTIIGARGRGEPAGAGTSHKNSLLGKPGSGKLGLGSLKGYGAKKPSAALRGIAIPSAVQTDLRGARIDPKRPPRGAIR